MKKRTFVTLVAVASFICIQIAYAGKDAKPGDCSQFKGRCDDPKIEMWEPCGFSKYELRYSTNYPEIVTYHGAGPMKQLSQLINQNIISSLPADRRSYLNISVSGTWCSGAVGCRVDRPAQLTFDPLGTINLIKLVRTFTCRGGSLKDLKIVANSIKMTNGQRVVWTKTYPAYIIPQFLEMETDPDKAPIVGYSVVQHTNVNDTLDGWFNNPVYDSGDYIGSGGGGGTIGPAPCDSIMP